MSDLRIDLKIKQSFLNPTAENFLSVCKQAVVGEVVIAVTPLNCIQFFPVKIGKVNEYRISILKKHNYTLERELCFTAIDKFYSGGADSYIINGRKILGLL